MDSVSTKPFDLIFTGLIKQKADIKIVENHINKLIEQKIQTAKKALEFLYDILDEMDELKV